MYATINNKQEQVKVIDANYGEGKVEVEIIDGAFKGARTIIEAEELGMFNLKNEIKEYCDKIGVTLEIVTYEKQNTSAYRFSYGDESTCKLVNHSSDAKQEYEKLCNHINILFEEEE